MTRVVDSVLHLASCVWKNQIRLVGNGCRLAHVMQSKGQSTLEQQKQPATGMGTKLFEQGALPVLAMTVVK